jgi:hypothetical protein
MATVIQHLGYSWSRTFVPYPSAGKQRQSICMEGKPAIRIMPLKAPRLCFIAASFPKLARDPLNSVLHVHIIIYGDSQQPILFQVQPQGVRWRRMVNQSIKPTPIPQYRLTRPFIINRPPICFRNE